MEAAILRGTIPSIRAHSLAQTEKGGALGQQSGEGKGDIL